MNEKEMWNLYINSNDVKNKTYDAWSFGEGPSIADALATLVLKGVKTATTSAYQLYELENIPLPSIGGLNIILDSDNNAVCITETTKVYTCPFSEVSEAHAFKEGAGDKTLSRFFSEKFKTYGLKFNERMLVVCEEFEVLFK